MVVADVARGGPEEDGPFGSLKRLAAALQLPAHALSRMYRRAQSLGAGVTEIGLALDRQHPEIYGRSSPMTVATAMGVLHGAKATSTFDWDALAGVMECGGACVTIAARLWPAEGADLEVHVDPRAGGPLRAPARMEAALWQLGLVRAWHHVLDVTSRGPWLDELVDLGIHCDEQGVRRVDVRVRHRDVTAEALAVAARIVRGVDPQRMVRAFHRLMDDSAARPGFAPGTTLSFDARDGGTAVALALWMPMRGWLRDDADVCCRIDALSSSGRRSGSPIETVDGLHRTVLTQLLATPLDARCATNGVTLQASADGERIVLDLRLEVARSGGEERRLEDRATGANSPDSSALGQVSAHEDLSSLTLHPFVTRELREARDASHVWLLLDNICESFSQHASRRLAGLIVRIDDDRIRSLLARQLDAELGGGDFTRSRRRVLRELLDAAARGHPAATSRLPGHQLSARLDAIYADEHPFVGLGAAVTRPIVAAQIGAFVATRLEMSGESAAAERLLHVLPIGPGPESTELLRAIEHDDERRAAVRGVRAVHAACWAALDGMYRLCFPA